MAPSLLLPAGCVKYRIVRQGYEPPPEAQGALYVATDKPILVGVEGTDAVEKKNMAGYYLLSPGELEVFVKALREVSEKGPDG